MSMRGWGTDDGWWFTFASDPTFRCPYNIAPARAEGDPALVATVAEFARRLGMDPHKLLRKLVGWGSHSGRARDGNGKLTDRCDGCGARMERLGFFVKVERPATGEEIQVGDGISMALYGGPPLRTHKSTHLPTKKEARQWAYDEYQVHRSTLSPTPSS